MAILIMGICWESSAQTLGTTDQAGGIDNRKIVVLSDPHVMVPELLVNEGTAWTTYLSGQRKMEDYSQSLFDNMIERIKQDPRPGLVLISGDLTKDGEQVSHQYVTGKLDELRAMGIQTLVIPGNHDRGNNSDAVYYDGEDVNPSQGWLSLALTRVQTAASLRPHWTGW